MDLLMEYRVLESRIIDGALSVLLANRGEQDNTAPEDDGAMNAADAGSSEAESG